MLRKLSALPALYSEQLGAGGETCWFENFERKATPLFGLLEDVEKHKARITMPKTNEQKASQPKPSNVIGYRYVLAPVEMNIES